jgi:hypothetical protein
MANTDIAVSLAEARGVAEWSAGELHTLLTVYGSQLPAEVVRSLTKMQASLAAVADSTRTVNEP